jgi:hypothetical protein
MPGSQLDVGVIAAIKAKVEQALPGCQVNGPVGKGQAQTLKVHGRLFDGKAIDIDFTPNVVIQHPGADCSAGNLMLRPEGLLGLKATAVEGVVDIETSIQHAINSQFVFFYAHSSRSTPQATYKDTIRRLVKYFKWGWTCLSPLPPDVLQAVQQQGLSPKLAVDQTYQKLDF